ncbi:translation initiation factor eIF-3, subunit D [Gorgonomyces haynaldii]|nr:translation initiation factor eIF-3, subunit D [Gorgonomyces haynaldii]
MPGPSFKEIPLEFTEIPYTPFNKSERIGKIADWTSTEQTLEKKDDRLSKRGLRMPENLVSTFTYQYPAQDEASFSVVDRLSLARKLRPNKSTGLRGAAKQANGTWIAAPSSAVKPSKGSDRKRYEKPQQRLRDPSIKINENWKLLDELDFVRMSKLHYEPEAPEDIAVHGFVKYVDRSWDRLTTKSEKPLPTTEKTRFNGTAQEDKVLQDLASDVDGKVVITTDTVLAALMCTSKSFYSWDLIITKKDGTITFDKRNGGPLDFVMVNENASEPPVDLGDKEFNINGPQQLAYEATHINKNYPELVLKQDEQVVFSNPNPFMDGESPETVCSGAYRYRRWELGDTVLLMRTQLDAAVHAPKAGGEPVPDIADASHPVEETLFARVKCLNEFDYRAVGAGGAPDWRQNLDSQRGAVLATEMKNNSNKLSRWTTEAILSGADQLRLGFVSRVNPRERKRHTVLGTAVYKPTDFATQIGLNVHNGWGIAKAFIDLCYERLGDGKFVLVKDPNKPLLRLYQATWSVDQPIAEPEDEEDEQ